MDSLYPKTKWFNVIHRPESKAVKPKIQLFCFPFAGTSPYMFNIRWAKSLPLSCQVIGVAYPGRGVRIEETSFTSVTKLVDNLLRDTREWFSKSRNLPFFFYGHSYGAACAYEMARRLQLEHLALPKHLICSGHLPMHFNPFLPCIGRLPDDELQEEMLKRYGSPIITDPKIKKIALPPLRADIIAVEQRK
ncbi:putative thioesterase involved in non-ribosomal peptide biosynthesis [Monocercomonoides exilis]|uniref:putative thioesterase involved in non-ribosomal peptide biosynthesis n=1 Tax=Monocercomonoides exilis TaxID=2049356 RepID=UPI0035595078|nr:putative thioesterase involved in non-ribosomal peptide biosynthesis [Monocercomonoides exilis]|eukprot:MONOS_770.1-p1 / transcript=MONOS_770.1 / gene=MONOS_770 / organism=Monocercomonoides_exilis_PA203 / gene_product=putative thioesterase involved in non-ribosomal peptide biosynthesis / transcript_product=putative thioesterase involved in non-ribosomal peptide biosynthesis / location=Mono_scaffold00013:56486-57185(+) / protein_length=190 / sequence_SO=supercontig / SO=protein_coding / is_pseudo=false